jgi:hypothetical protein
LSSTDRHGRVAARPGDGTAAHQNLAPRRRHQPGDQPQQRRLPATGTPDDRHELTVGRLQFDALKRFDGASPMRELLGHTP